MGRPIPTLVIVAVTTLPALAFAVLAVWVLTRKVRARQVVRRAAAAARRRPTGEVVADRLFGDLERRLADAAPHPRGCACSPECWDRYITGLVSEYPWDGKPRVVRQRDGRAGTR